MPTRTESLQAATQALAYVKSKNIKASNKLGDILFQPWNFWGGIWERHKREQKEKGLGGDAFWKMYAETAESSGKGNCAEQSAIAYFYLRDRLTFRPIQLMSFEDAKPDHNFVVVGKDPKIPASNVAQWGEAAIVCDPWLGEVYEPALLSSKWKDGIPRGEIYER